MITQKWYSGPEIIVLGLACWVGQSLKWASSYVASYTVTGLDNLPPDLNSITVACQS